MSPIAPLTERSGQQDSELVLKVASGDFISVDRDQADYTVAITPQKAAVVTADNKIALTRPRSREYAMVRTSGVPEMETEGVATHNVEVFYGTDREPVSNHRDRWLHHFLAFFQRGLGLIVSLVAGAVLATVLLLMLCCRWLTWGRLFGLTIPALLVILVGAAVNAHLLSRAGDYYSRRTG